VVCRRRLKRVRGVRTRVRVVVLRHGDKSRLRRRARESNTRGFSGKHQRQRVGARPPRVGHQAPRRGVLGRRAESVRGDVSFVVSRALRRESVRVAGGAEGHLRGRAGAGHGAVRRRGGGGHTGRGRAGRARGEARVRTERGRKRRAVAAAARKNAVDMHCAVTR